MWKITKNFLLPDADGYLTSKEGRSKKIDVRSANYKEEKEHRLIHPFRLYDGDGSLYYEGLSSSDSSFSPLDNYGAPNDGCTEIRYKNQYGQWETL